MSEFTPITTQEEFDAAIGDRLRRERENIEKKYGDHTALQTKVGDYEKQIADLNKQVGDHARQAQADAEAISRLTAQVKGYESLSVKTRIAREIGLPWELADRLSGETEEDIRKDAEIMARLMNTGNPSAPIGSAEPVGTDPKNAAMLAFARSL